MRTEEIQSLPTVSDLRAFQFARIAELKAAGEYNYETLQGVIVERDAITAREQVFYSRQDGTDGYVVIYGTARERDSKRQAVR